jgi:glycogen phosphorylase
MARPDLPPELVALGSLALDLRWTWSHETDQLWQRIDPAAWDQTRNPWAMLQDLSPARIRELANDLAFLDELQRLDTARNAYLNALGWFAPTYGQDALAGIAYFSMEFGLDEALPLYAGGLGVLAGDFLKTASDLGVPLVGIGLLYREGYFRQLIDAAGWQQESYPFNDAGSLPISPAQGADGAWLHIRLGLPGRDLTLRVWRVQVGRISLFLLDSDHPLNAPADRGITGRLYASGVEARLLQELVLGVAGWRVVEAVAPATEICHLNEGHAAFAAIERARAFSRRTGRSFRAALWATRAGNIFTTHTPVAAGFDRFAPDLIATYARYAEGFIEETGLPLAELLALGRADPNDATEPFNMAYLAQRGAARTIGVSRQHEAVSRRVFQPLFPRWPECEVPVGHITNGVHVPSWDSADADRLWTAACGRERWRCAPDRLDEQVAALDDATLWAMRGAGRHALVLAARRRLARQLGARGASPEAVEAAAQVLDPNVLTLGFARRFAEYKRPNLLLHDPDRLRRLLTDPARPAQLIVAGKAHPADDTGKRMIQEWIRLAQEPELRRSLVFLEDYDLALAQELVHGVDVWINTPRHPWEACGTSGMKVLVNGGLNLSVLDGWWEEAYEPGVGWAVGDGEPLDEAARDARDAARLHDVLANEVVPEFYDRDAEALPRRWLQRIRTSLSRLTPAYSSTRMLQEHVEQLYLPAVREYRRRLAAEGANAEAMACWELRLQQAWPRLHIGEPTIVRDDSMWQFSVPVYRGDLAAEDIRVELYAEPRDSITPVATEMQRSTPIAGSLNGDLYISTVAATRPAADYTVRVGPAFPGVNVPAELALVAWQK